MDFGERQDAVMGEQMSATNPFSALAEEYENYDARVIVRIECSVAELRRTSTLERELAEARREIDRLNAWADSFTDIHLRERQTGDAPAQLVDT